MVWILLSSAVAFAVAVVLTRQFSNPGSCLHLLDHPNERSLHTRPTPRTGGVAILAGILLALPLWFLATGGHDLIVWLLAAIGLIATLSFLDDRRGVSVAVRFPGHVIGAGLVVFGADFYLPGIVPGIPVIWPAWLGIGLEILFLVWMINLYNFMDGMDGLAGGMAVIGFGTLALFGLLSGNPPFATLSLVIAAATCGFLLFNFPPARIFMGDTGSAVLGLLAGGLILWGARDEIIPLWIGLLVFSPFIVDASVTLVRRLLRGERVWQAHRTHYYQRLVQCGWSHRKTALFEYALMAACSLSALLARQLEARGQVVVVLAWFLVYSLLMVGVRRMEIKTKR